MQCNNIYGRHVGSVKIVWIDEIHQVNIHILIFVSADDYGDLIDWQQLHPQLRSSNYEYTRTSTYDSAEETEGVQSKERCAYVKVNMDSVIVGRKICVFDHADYSSLAVQLEEMFGMH